jgi:hypothetical protein
VQIAAGAQVELTQNIYFKPAGHVSIRGDVSNSGTMLIGADSSSAFFSLETGTIDGTYTQSATGTLVFELAGLLPEDGDGAWNGYDVLYVLGDVHLDGSLLAELAYGFVLQEDAEFCILHVDGELNGTFAGLGEGKSVLTDPVSGLDLFITYQGGDGNDVTLYTVPEPTSLLALSFGAVATLLRRRFP